MQLETNALQSSKDFSIKKKRGKFLQKEH